MRETLGFPLRYREVTADIVQGGLALFLKSAESKRFADLGELRNSVLRYARYELRHRARYWKQDKRDLEREASALAAEDEPVGRAEAYEGEDFVRFFLERLGADRKLLELRIFEDLSFSELAERLGLQSPGAARKRYERAVQRLGEHVGVHARHGLTAALFFKPRCNETSASTPPD